MTKQTSAVTTEKALKQKKKWSKIVTVHWPYI